MYKNEIIILFYFHLCGRGETKGRGQRETRRGSSQMSFKYWFLILPIFPTVLFTEGSGLVFSMDIILTFCFPDVHLIIVSIDFACIACLLIININSSNACDCLFLGLFFPSFEIMIAYFWFDRGLRARSFRLKLMKTLIKTVIKSWINSLKVILRNKLNSKSWSELSSCFPLRTR